MKIIFFCRLSDDKKELTLSPVGLAEAGDYRVRGCLKNDLCGFVEFSLNIVNDVLTPVVEVLMLY